MGFLRHPWLVFLCWVFPALCFTFQQCYGSQVSVNFLRAPHALSRRSSAKFVFQVLVGRNGTCSGCKISCKLDDHHPSDCRKGEIFYSGLHDGDHTLEVCAKSNSGGHGCANRNWTVDTTPPTAYVTASMQFTNALNVSVNISFSEPCMGGRGFGCSSMNACNLLVYGAGQVIPSSFTVLEPYLRYSVLVGLSSSVLYGRAILTMDKNICTDAAGNVFQRSANSTFYVHFDRRDVFVDLRTRVPEMLLELNNETRAVQATNNYDRLKVYLYFSAPILNSSSQILRLLNTSEGQLVPIGGENPKNRRLGYTVENVSKTAIVTLSVDSSSIVSKQGTHVTPTAPVTLLYDSVRPRVSLSTTVSMRTRDCHIPVLVKFTKPVFGFNASRISVSGGKLWTFREVTRAAYIAEIQAESGTLLVNIAENATEDVAGNKNLASNTLEVIHYPVPVISSVVSILSTSVFLVTCFFAGLLTVSTASLQSLGLFSRPSSRLTSDPIRSLFRSACHVQFYAFTWWLPVRLPVEYYEFVRGLRWIIPYFHLPWEDQSSPIVSAASSRSPGPRSFFSKIMNFGNLTTVQSVGETLNRARPANGLPLTAIEYRSFFETPRLKPEAEYISDRHSSAGWREFDRIMFWLAIICGSLIVLHVFFYLILKFRKASAEKQRSFGPLIFPRFEIFLITFALPSVCKASRSLVKDFFRFKRKAAAPEVILGIVLLSVVAVLLLGLLLFLTIGITLGKLLQYKEIHQEGQKFHWYQELIRVTLGPGKRGQWTWKHQPESIYLPVLGPLFEDLRGPPKYMLSQIAGGNSRRQGDRIIASDDENEDAEAPFIQKLFGILRIYFTFLETLKRVSLGIVAGGFSSNEISKTPIIFLLCLVSFQLFFIVLKKPFIKKKVQLVEIISIACEVAVIATCTVLVKYTLSAETESRVGIFMVVLFILAFFALMCSEWYALYSQTRLLDQKDRSYLKGLKIALLGIISLFIPQKCFEGFETEILSTKPAADETNNPGSLKSPSASRSSGSTDKPWLRQLREVARASFSRDWSHQSNEPSGNRSRRSGLWGTKRSGGSSSDGGKSRKRGLSKDLEAIFASR